MSVRERINRNPRTAVGAVTATAVIASIVAALQFSSAGTELSASDNDWFTSVRHDDQTDGVVTRAGR